MFINVHVAAALRNVINLNQPPVNTMVNEPEWKILVMDKAGQEIISPLLSVKQLRELGVTLHLLVYVLLCFRCI